MSNVQNSGQATISFDTNSDSIDTLPTDQNNPSHAEIQIVDSLFKQKHNTVQKLLGGTKDVLIVGFIFLLFSLPQFDDLVKKFIPTTEKSPYILVGVKAVLFAFVYFLVKNLNLVRKRN
jgi:hypothetical protein